MLQRLQRLNKQSDSTSAAFQHFKLMKILIRFSIVLLLLFALLNVILYNHAWQLTHFTAETGFTKKKPEDLTFLEKGKLAFTGVTVSRPENKNVPSNAFETLKIPGRFELEAWLVQVPEPKGVVLLFHGYQNSKSGMVGYGNRLNAAGYHTMLVDFPGSGGSDGLETSLGFHEGGDVQRSLMVVDSLFPELPTTLIGSSMGAASIMRAVHAHGVQPDKIILECPFGTLLGTIRKRFDALNAPSYPFAEMLMFYGGWQSGFDAFEHNPEEYARSISIPTLLMSGTKDARVSVPETEQIFENLAGPKKLVFMKNSGHQSYLVNDVVAWEEAVLDFLE